MRSTARQISFAAAILVATPLYASDTYRKVDLEDFFLDRRQMIGQKVKVEAQIQAFGDTVFIVLDRGRNATFVAIDSVPRENRKTVLQRCTTPCAGEVTGTVAPLAGDVGIKADDVLVK